MSYFELIVLALALSMDAFAVAVGIGLSSKASNKSAGIVGLYFGFFQGLMPVIGFFAGTFFAAHVTAYSHWISFGLLTLLGAKMIHGSFTETAHSANSSLAPRVMLPFAIATSIDAMAVGVSLAFLYVNIVFAAVVIGVITFAVSAAGVRLGGIFGAKYKNKAAFAGGVILILIGVNILLSHTTFYQA